MRQHLAEERALDRADYLTDKDSDFANTSPAWSSTPQTDQGARRNVPGIEDIPEGTSCTINGWPGKWKRVNGTMTCESLEKRIAAALADPQVTSTDLVELIDEAELAVATAEETARAEYEKALDPVASPDAAKAKRSIWAAEFSRDRLRAFLSRLWERLDEIETAEKATRWEADYAAIEAKRDALASEFAEMYPRLTAQLCDLFKRAKAIDEECARINGEALSGEHRRLLGVELTARNLGSFTRSNPSLMDAVKFSEWANSDRMVWPLPQAPLAARLAASMAPPPDARFTANWAAAREKDVARRAAVEARWAKEEEARQAESGRAYEAGLRR
jgi:hypothetical protein